MILFLFGMLDFLSALGFILSYFDVGSSFVFILALFLLIKALIFFSSVVSMVDLLAAVLLFFAASGHATPLNFVFMFWLLQKALFSFFGE